MPCQGGTQCLIVELREAVPANHDKVESTELVFVHTEALAGKAFDPISADRAAGAPLGDRQAEARGTESVGTGQNHENRVAGPVAGPKHPLVILWAQ